MATVSFREWHSYISAFIAPMMLFFASSGALQIFNLHESHAGYVAPAIVGAASRLHKQQMVGPERQRGFEFRPGEGTRPPLDAQRAEGSDREGARSWSPATVFLKWLFFLEACAFVITLLLGVWIGLTHAKRRRTVVALLIAGILVPAIPIVWQIKTGA